MPVCNLIIYTLDLRFACPLLERRSVCDITALIRLECLFLYAIAADIFLERANFVRRICYVTTACVCVCLSVQHM